MIKHSSVTGNMGSGSGGISSSGALTVQDSTIAENVATSWGNLGGAVNSDGAGGVFVTDGTARFINVTMVDNRYEPSPNATPPSRLSGGLYVAGGSVSVANSVLALNHHDQPIEGNGLDCSGPVTSMVHYLQSYRVLLRPCGRRPHRGRPQAWPIWRNGGPTTTRVPLPGSPLIDQGSPAMVGSHIGQACSRHDQRGKRRPYDADRNGVARCDIGAVERRPSDHTSSSHPRRSR